MTRLASTAIRHRLVVNASIERAFSVFTARFGDFKPREHNLLRVPIAETVFECVAGAHIYDRSGDYSVCRWARVLVSSTDPRTAAMRNRRRLDPTAAGLK